MDFSFNSNLDFEERNERLKKIFDTTQDEKLKAEIKKRFDEDDKFFKIFKENNGDYVYLVEIFEEDYESTVFKREQTVFTNYDDAFSTCIDYLKQENEFGKRAFEIEKHLLCSKEKMPNKDRFESIIGGLSFSANAKPRSYWMKEEFHCRCYGSRHTFEYQFIFLPDPFELGDRVKVVSDHESLKDEEWYVACTKKDWYAVQERFKKGGKIRGIIDWSDVCLPVTFGDMEDYIRNHEHVNPIYLEKI